MGPDGRIVIEEQTPASEPGRSVVGPFALAIVLAVSLIGLLIAMGGMWNLVANTRLLDILIKGGVIAYHDEQTGFIEGVRSYGDYLKSQDPIDWSVVFVGFFIFYVHWLLKGFQFHLLSRFYGSDCTWGQHLRSYYQGLWYNLFLPFRVGDVATIETMRGSGVPIDRAAGVMRVMRLFTIFEVAVFALIALAGTGWGPWLAQLFWALVILLVAWLFVRRPRGESAGQSLLRSASVAFRELARKPRLLAGLAALSLVSFMLVDVAAYCAAMAFTGDVVRLHVDYSVLLMGVVACYIARMIPLTPGGIGLLEWGFASALAIGGVGVPEAVTIAVLFNLMRYTAYLQFYYIVINVPPRSGHQASSSTIFATFRRSRPEAA